MILQAPHNLIRSHFYIPCTIFHTQDQESQIKQIWMETSSYILSFYLNRMQYTLPAHYMRIHILSSYYYRRKSKVKALGKLRYWHYHHLNNDLVHHRCIQMALMRYFYVWMIVHEYLFHLITGKREESEDSLFNNVFITFYKS